VSALDNATTGIMLSKMAEANAVRATLQLLRLTYDAYGMYRVTLDTTDTASLGALKMSFAASCFLYASMDGYRGFGTDYV